MIAAVFADVGLADFHGDLIRNIVSLRVSQDLFDDLSEDPEHWRSAIALEMATKPAFFVSAQPIINRPFEEAAWNDAIDYPFRHWQRSRYSDGSYGVWYGADRIETSVHETVHHWRNGFLQDADMTQPGIRIERSVYQVRCDAALLDLRPVVKRLPALVDGADYSLTQQVGARLHREGHPGVLTRSARSDGEVYPIFNRNVLSKPRQFCHLSYATTVGGVAIEREPGLCWFEIPDRASEHGSLR